jgi:N-acetylmuramoyl-L-alanine amidase
MRYDIIQNYITSRNRPGLKLSAQGIVVHSTDNPGATAQNHHDYWQREASAKASAHAVIDWTAIMALIPVNEIAWHAGPTANGRFLGVELCEPYNGDYTKFNEVWNRAVWFVAQKCLAYGWNTVDHVFSHRGITLMYGDTDHMDPIPYFAKYGKTWDDFLAAVDQEMKGGGDLSIDQALEVLAQHGIIAKKEYWKAAADIVKYLDTLIINTAQRLQKLEVK